MINWHHQIRWNGPRNTKYTSNNISLYLVCCVVMCLCTQLLKAQRYFHLPFSPINCVAPVRTYICHTCSFMNFGDLIKFPVSPSVDQSRGANQTEWLENTCVIIYVLFTHFLLVCSTIRHGLLRESDSPPLW